MQKALQLQGFCVCAVWGYGLVRQHGIKTGCKAGGIVKLGAGGDDGLIVQKFRQYFHLGILLVGVIECLQFLDDQTATLSDSSRLTTFRQGVASKVKPATEPRARARENLVHVLMNHNDFVTVR